MSNNPLRAVPYIRMSTDKQAASPERQRDLFAQYCERWGLVAVGEYADEGVSATHTKLEDREGMMLLLADAKRGLFDIVWCEDRNRISRQLKDWFFVRAALVEQGVAIVAHEGSNPHVEHNTAEAEALDGVMAVFARYWAAQQSALIKRAQKKIMTEGGYQGGRLPLGIRWDGERFALDEATQGFAIRAFECFVAEDGSCHRAALRMSAEGWRGARGGKLWSSTIWHIVHNPAYRGKRRGLKAEWDAPLPEVIPPALVAEADALLSLQQGRRQRTTHAKALFLGILACPHCGNYLSVNARPGKVRGEVRRYRCHMAYLVEPSCDWRKSVGEKRMEAVIVPLLCEKLREVLADVTAPAHRREAKKRDTHLRKRRDLEAAKSRLVSLYVDGQITQDDYQQRAEELAAQLGRLEQPEDEARTVTAAEVKKLLRLLEEAWPLMTAEEQRKLLLTAVSRIIPNPASPQESQVIWRTGV